MAMLEMVINAGYPPVRLPFFGLKGKGSVVVVKFKKINQAFLLKTPSF